MKRIVFLGVLSLLFCTISVGTFAQDKKMTRKEKEELVDEITKPERSNETPDHSK